MQLYKKSLYNLTIEQENEYIIFNTFSGAIVRLSDDEFAMFNQSDEFLKSPDLQSYVKLGLVLPADVDEQKIINYDRINGMYSTETLTFRILTTTKCNAKCFYCYEKNMEILFMSIDTADLVSRFIISRAEKSKTVNIQWFGGEPLMNTKAIDYITAQLNDKLISKGIRVIYSMISNGVLFDSDLIKKAKHEWHLERIQISLDGYRSEYEKRKQYAAIPNAFDKVIDNIEGLLSQDIYVSVRLNFDSDNLNSILELIQFLGAKFHERNNFRCYAYPLFKTSASDIIEAYSSTSGKELLIIIESLVDNNLYLEMQDTFLNNEVFPITLEELDENYISVLEFLNNAEYIGRESYREVPIYYSSKTPDYSFVADEFHPFGAKSNLDNKEECSHDETISEDKKRKFVILYKGETHLICYHNTGHGNFLSTPRSRLCIFDQRHVDDKWKFIGEELGMYKDYDDVITELSTDLPVEVKTKQKSK